MTSKLLRFSGNGSVDIFVQNRNRNSATHTLFRRFRGEALLNCQPASPFAFGESENDCVVAALPDNPLVSQLLVENEVNPGFIPGAFLVKPVIHGQRLVIVITGGDWAGLLYGISDFARNLSKADTGLLYTGGEKLEKPVFPFRGYWVTDTRARWNGDCEFPVYHCCLLDYPYDAATYVDNMKRIVDGMIDYRKNVLTIWGFIRDEHGGIEAAQEVCRYANDRGIDVCPGIGTHFYGGPYYRGDHPFNLDTYIKTHPQHMNIGSFGCLRPCPSDPDNIAWLKEGVHWLFDACDIAGVNLENGDYFYCGCDRCRTELDRLESDNPMFIRNQYLSYKPVLEELVTIPQSKWNVYATYTGFSPDVFKIMDPLDFQYDEDEQKRHDILMVRNPIKDKALKHAPAFASLFPEKTIAQWNIDCQLRQFIPLKTFLDDGNPDVIYGGPLWPRSLNSPCQQNIFYSTRRDFDLSVIKELAVRTAEGGYEGVIDYGEYSPRDVGVEMIYLAQSHFAYHPLDSLRGFASAQLAHRVGGEDYAQTFIELLCKKDAGELTPDDQATIRRHENEFMDAMIHKNATADHPANYAVDHFDNWYPHNYWRWLRG